MTFAIILIALIKDRQHDAATWSAIGQHLQVTQWPFIFQSDSAASNVLTKRIEWKVFFLSLVGLLGTVSLIAASFLTPKPLVSSIQPANQVTNEQFHYASDESFYGQGTLPRPANPIRRTCGANLYMDCPNSIYDNPSIRNQYVNHTVVNSTIPQETVQIFSSGTKNSTVAGPLDIQYRNWYEWRTSYVDNGEKQAQGIFLPLQTFVLDDKYQVIEGLVVDAIHGGIGIRNHSIPSGLSLGAQWTEDLLWIQPESACTSTNLSLHFTLSDSYFYQNVNGSLRDDGGFSRISPNPPEPRWDQGGWRDISATPDLKSRANVAAWWNNQLVAQTLNITSSKFGSIIGGLNAYALFASTTSLKVEQFNGGFLDQAVYYMNGTAWRMFNAYGARCAGYDDTDPSTTSKAFITCGYVYSIPYPSDEANKDYWRPDLSSNWTQQLYTCASAAKASVKTVTFVSGSNDSLANLSVASIKPKSYTSGSLPYWGVEKVNGSRYGIGDIPLFWGLVDQSYVNSPDIDVVQAESIYLPAASHSNGIGEVWTDSFAAGSAFTSALISVYKDAASVKGTSETYVPSYSGENDYGLALKWRNLSSTPEGAATILNLIWTDLVSFATVGTKNGFEVDDTSDLVKRDTSQTILGTRQVQRNVRVLEYKDIRYAIPALVAAGLFVLGFLGFLLLTLTCIVSPRIIIHYMNQTSMGRAYTQAENPDEVKSYWTTAQWLDMAGGKVLNIPGARKKMKLEKLDMASSKGPRSSGNSTSTENLGLTSGHRTRYGTYGPIPGSSPDNRGNWAVDD